MRLIDADEIPYTMLYKENFLKGTGVEAQAAWKSDIDNIPTVDAVPVIRCGECGHFKKLHIDRGLCLQTEGCVRLRDFCSYAERKEE